MDSLLQHCLRELAFDGEYGSNVLRLRDFVNGYYASHASQHQCLDDSYHAFVWSLLSQHTSVRVGLVAEEQLAQVYIPPFSKAKKNVDIDCDHRESGFEPIQDVAAYSLQELVHLYGDQLRIAVDPVICLETITGHHTRPSKLTPTVYACLQLIARTREVGLSVLDLGRKSGYDQKTCFYIVKTLVELDLIVKLRRGGASMNFCVHKYFFERSAIWREVREEDMRNQTETTRMTTELDHSGSIDNVEHIASRATEFSPIDTRHLSNLNILRQRLTTYLRQSEDGIRPYHNIAVKIGFHPRSRTDRRFFIARLKELVAEGTIEKVAIADKISEVSPSKQLGLRLARTSNIHHPITAQSTNNLDFEESDMVDEDPLDDQCTNSFKLITTLHRQIVEMLSVSGASGMTLQELSTRLCSFDKRTLEQAITHMKNQRSLPHLSDLAVIDTLEMHGRERRYRYFTAMGYSALLEREKIDTDNKWVRPDLDIVGDFMDTETLAFYSTTEELERYLSDSICSKATIYPDMADQRRINDVQVSGGQKRGRPPKKEKRHINPLLPDGKRKRGRPPKSGKEPAAEQNRESTRTTVAPDDDVGNNHVHNMTIETAPRVEKVTSNIVSNPKRKGGRPPKKKARVLGPSITVEEPASEEKNRNDPGDQPDVSTLSTVGDSECKQNQGLNISDRMQECAAIQQRQLDTQGDRPIDPHMIEELKGSTITAEKNVPMESSNPVDIEICPPTEREVLIKEVAMVPLIRGSRLAQEDLGKDAGLFESETQADNYENSSVYLVEKTPTPISIGIPSTARNRDERIEEYSNIISNAKAAGKNSLRKNSTEASAQLATSRNVTLRPSNITAARRSNELLQLIVNAGGIVNTTGSDIYRRHEELIEKLTDAGEPTSAPVGTRMDRRTLIYTLEKLEETGQIKMTTTTLQNEGRQRLAYLSSMPEEGVRDFIAKQSERNLEQIIHPQKERKTQNLPYHSTSGVAASYKRKLASSRSSPNVPYPGLMEDIESKKKERMLKDLHRAQEELDLVKTKERAWETLIHKVRPGLLKGVAEAKLRRLRRSYISGTKTQEDKQWEEEIAEAILAAEKNRLYRSLPQKVTRKAGSGELSLRAEITTAIQPVSIPPAEHTIGIRRSKSEIPESRKAKKSSKAQIPADSKLKRRKRFQWTSEDDELARDTYVILSSRCRSHHRIIWSAVKQVFPSIRRDSVRIRLYLLEKQPGAKQYLQRLEDCWHELWMKYRGSIELPDGYPYDLTDFDLKAHLAFLRKHIDKNALRVGIPDNKERSLVILPANIELLNAQWKILERVENNSESPLNSTTGDDARKLAFLEEPLAIEPLSAFGSNDVNESVNFAESAVKVVIGTRDEKYDEDAAADILRKIGESNIEMAVDDLLSRNVFSKLTKESARVIPGRTVKFSEANQDALNGLFPAEVFQDASQLEESYIVQTDWTEWPFISSDGDTAAILQHFSDHNVDIRVNMDNTRAAREMIEGNSRRADDDDIELKLLAKLGAVDVSSSATTVHKPVATSKVTEQGHGLSISGDTACCKLQGEGVYDCVRCIQESSHQLNAWPEVKRDVAAEILRRLECREEKGLEVRQLKTFICEAGFAEGDMLSQLIQLQVPLIYIVGYSEAVAVSAKHVGTRTIVYPTAFGFVGKKFPRRWLEIDGNRNEDVWKAAVRATIGLIHLRPGISQEELCCKLRFTYDRPEIIEILGYLLKTDRVCACMDGETGCIGINHPCLISRAEEKVFDCESPSRM